MSRRRINSISRHGYAPDTHTRVSTTLQQTPSVLVVGLRIYFISSAMWNRKKINSNFNAIAVSSTIKLCWYRGWAKKCRPHCFAHIFQNTSVDLYDFWHTSRVCCGGALNLWAIEQCSLLFGPPWSCTGNKTINNWWREVRVIECNVHRRYHATEPLLLFAAANL